MVNLQCIMYVMPRCDESEVLWLDLIFIIIPAGYLMSIFQVQSKSHDMQLEHLK